MARVLILIAMLVVVVLLQVVMVAVVLVQVVLGGGVQGGRFHGEWRGLGQLLPRGLNSSYEDLPVLNNYRNVLAPVLLRHGAPAADLGKVFPDFTLAPLPLYG